MPKEIKLYQILEKADIGTKIAVEIQDWIIETMDEKQVETVVQFEERKLLPMHEDMNREFKAVRSDMNREFKDVRLETSALRSDMEREFKDVRFEITSLRTDIHREFKVLRAEMDLRFEAIQSRFDSLEKMFYVLTVPIIGSTIGGLGIIFYKIYEGLR